MVLLKNTLRESFGKILTKKDCCMLGLKMVCTFRLMMALIGSLFN